MKRGLTWTGDGRKHEMKGTAKSPPSRVWKGFHGACCGTESTYAEGSTPSPWQRLFVTSLYYFPPWGSSSGLLPHVIGDL